MAVGMQSLVRLGVIADNLVTSLSPTKASSPVAFSSLSKSPRTADPAHRRVLVRRSRRLVVSDL
jgi:hypothetical protein